MTLLFACVTAFVGTVAAVPLCARLARATGLVDRPGPLKLQTVPVPYLGGAAVMAGLLLAAWTRVRTPEIRVEVVLPLCLALLLGVADDARDLPVSTRLVGELAIGGALAWAVPTRLGPVGAVAVIALVLVLVNGVNLLDGLDALASAVVAGSAAGFGLILTGGARVAALTLLGAVLGFLLYNRPPARIYLGDGGSYLLGTALAVLVALAWNHGTGPGVPVASLLLVALPVAEITWAVVRRKRAGRSLLGGDRGHSYDRLAARGYRSGTIAALAATVQVLLGVLAFGVSRADVGVAVGVTVAAGAALMIVGAAAGFLRPVDELAH